jgi:hypothetical protein
VESERKKKYGKIKYVKIIDDDGTSPIRRKTT